MHPDDLVSPVVRIVDEHWAEVDGVRIRRVSGGAITALQSNAQPQGGTTATQPVSPPLTSADIEQLVEQMTPVVTKFREQSSPLKVACEVNVSMNLGGQVPTRLPSVGLGVRLITHWNVVYSLVNTATVAQTVQVGNAFPFNHIASTQIQINGGATIYSADGLGTFAVMTRNKPGTWDVSGSGGFGLALSKALVKVTAGANVNTVVNATGGGNFSGIATFNVAASQTGILTVDFWTVEKLALDRQSLLGLFPAQNNSTYATITRQVVASAIGATSDQRAPLSTSGAVPGTLTVTAVTTINSTYDFWSVPSDPGLYQEMVPNSYQVQQQKSISVAVTGPAALTYNIPQNQFLVAAHLWATDGNNALMAQDSGGITLLRLVYNAQAIQPVQHFADRERAAQFLDYGDDRQFIGGYRFWDGEDTTEMVQVADQAGWIDTYAAATPQLIGDIAAAAVTPLTFSITRESVVAGAVQVVGG